MTMVISSCLPIKTVYVSQVLLYSKFYKRSYEAFSDHSLIITYTYESSISVKIKCVWTRLHGIFSHFLSVFSRFSQLLPFFTRQRP